jgi:hypothetical protein
MILNYPELLNCLKAFEILNSLPESYVNDNIDWQITLPRVTSSVETINTESA